MTAAGPHPAGVRRSLVVGLFLLVTVTAAAQVFPRRPGGGAGGGASNGAALQVPECVTVRAEARQDGVGFMHVVIVHNACTAAVRCRIATDADPTPEQSLRVAAGRTEEVVTRAGSPVPGVQPRAVCVVDGAAGR